MNRDGFRAPRRVAEHEAAHAVIATLCGLVVCRVDIAPSQQDRASDMDGATHFDFPHPDVPWPVPLSPAADIDMSAAGLAWELTHWTSPLEAWRASHGDREGHSLIGFLRAAMRVRRTLRRPGVAASVTAVADALQASKSGMIYGTRVDKIMNRFLPPAAQPASARSPLPVAERVPPRGPLITLVIDEMASLGREGRDAQPVAARGGLPEILRTGRTAGLLARVPLASSRAAAERGMAADGGLTAEGSP